MWILKRLAEPSSHAGLAAAISAAAGAASGAMPWSIAGPALLAGLLAVLMPDRRR